MRHHLQDASVELLSAFISTAKLMEDHTVLDEQNTLAKAGSIRIMGHHQDRCLFVAVQSGQFFHNVSCILGIQSTGRYCVVSKNDSFVQLCFSLAPIRARSGLRKRQIAQKEGRTGNCSLPGPLLLSHLISSDNSLS